MSFRLLFIASLLCTGLFLGCKKSTSSETCEALKDAIIADNKEDAKAAVARFVDQLPSNNYTSTNLAILAASITGPCGITAEVICFDCVDTYPSQSELILSLNFSGSLIKKFVDISYTPGNKMNVVRIHD